MTCYEGDILRCDHCGEVIGVYEPMIVVNDGKARRGSRTADTVLSSETAQRYHRSCYINGYELFGSHPASSHRLHLGAAAPRPDSMDAKDSVGPRAD